MHPPGLLRCDARNMGEKGIMSRPNIVFVLCDDLGVNDLHCYGREDHNTPHLDRLAEQGMRFTSAYASQAICSASRAGLLTALNPARLHLTTFLPGRPDTLSQRALHPEIMGGKAEYELTRETIRFIEMNADRPFVAYGDGTVTDLSTTLMWSRADSGAGHDWSNALAWVQARNGENCLG
jgi:hypothetical protein